MYDRSKDLNPSQPSYIGTTAEIETSLARSLNHPHLVIDDPDIRHNMREFMHLDPRKAIVEQQSFRGLDISLICIERIENSREDGENLIVNVRRDQHRSDKPDQKETFHRTYKVTSDGLFLEKGPLGMSGLMYSHPADECEFTDFCCQLHRWKFVGDFTIPETDKVYSGVFALHSSSQPEYPDYFAPGIGKFYSTTENGIILSRQLVDISSMEALE